MQAARSAQRTRSENLESVLAAIRAKADNGRDSVSIAEILDAFGHRAYGPLILIIGLIASSPLTLIPGMTSVSAFLALVVAGQMLVGLPHPWLPRGALERAFPNHVIVEAIDRLQPWAKRIDWFIRPRLEFLAEPPLVWFVGLFTLAAAIITIPLGFFPLLPLLPSIAILLFGLGMVARDGLLLTLGMGLFGGSLALGWRFIWGFAERLIS